MAVALPAATLDTPVQPRYDAVLARANFSIR